MSAVAGAMQKQGLLPPPAAPAGRPPAEPAPPAPPPNVKQTIADGVKQANARVKAINGVVSTASSGLQAIADPGAAIAGALGGAVDEKMSSLTNGLAAAMPPFPAASMTGMALGIPHAHVKHPPSGPPPVPPTPLPPLGPIMVGNCISVLVNGKPAARCGDFGFNPTCCGVVPPLSAMFEIVTGSSKIYIGGKRAARANIDITMHCFHVPSPKVMVKSAALAKVASAVGKVTSAAGKAAAVVGKVAQVVGVVSTAANFAAEFAEAEANDDSAMAAAVALSAAMMAAQAAADAAAAALTKQIGTDQPAIPPVGTPGMILVGSGNVLISGVPLPSFTAIAQGLAKRLKGLKFTSPGGKPGKGGRAGTGP
jgi:uncharacterized Zn-binding protein involved in type VI secretion